MHYVSGKSFKIIIDLQLVWSTRNGSHLMTPTRVQKPLQTYHMDFGLSKLQEHKTQVL